MNDKQPCHRVDRKQLQFGTRTLLLGIAACAVLLVVLQHVGPVWGLMILWFLVLAAAHVAANARGSRHLADACAPDRARTNADEFSAVSRQPAVALCFAPATGLRDSKGFGRMLLAVTASSATVGLLCETTALLLLTQANVGGVVLGGISAAILSGFLGFTTGSFVMVATRSFQEAVHEQRGSGVVRAGNSS